jgi:hypothetical protein
MACRDLTVCLDCRRDFVCPVEWVEAGPMFWRVLLHCGWCGRWESGLFDQVTVDAFDVRLDVLERVLLADARRFEAANMAREVDGFVAALAAGAILPEDF